MRETDAGRVEPHSFELRTGVALYLITYTDYPNPFNDPKLSLEKARDGAVAGVIERCIDS